MVVCLAFLSTLYSYDLSLRLLTCSFVPSLGPCYGLDEGPPKFPVQKFHSLCEFEVGNLFQLCCLEPGTLESDVSLGH